MLIRYSSTVLFYLREPFVFFRIKLVACSAQQGRTLAERV